MPSPGSALPTSDKADAGETASSRRIRVLHRVGSFHYSFTASAASDSNATMSGLAGPGRPLGQLFSAAGRRLEAVVDRTAARAGLGFEGIARRLLMKLRAPHSRCRAWPDFAKTPVLDLAIELGSGMCLGCNQRYMHARDSANEGEVGVLLLRLVNSVESDLPVNRSTGALLLVALALSDDKILAALRESQLLQRVELSLHSCKIFTVQDNAWVPALRAMHDLRQVLHSLVPDELSMLELYSDERMVQNWHDLQSRRVSFLQGMLRTSPVMSSCVASRLMMIRAADHDFLQQLCKPSNQRHLDALYEHVLSSCSDKETDHAGKLFGTVVLLNAHTTPSLLATLLQLPLEEVVTLVQTFVGARLLTTENPLDAITDTTLLAVCHDSLYGFLIDPSRCRLSQYLISPSHHHEALVDRCLFLLNRHLFQDICDIQTPGIANKEVNLPSRIAQSVPEAVRYACVAWPVHIVACGTVSGMVSAALLDFCTNHLLHWLEVLSLLGELPLARKHLPRITEWCQGHLVDVTSRKEISALLSDVYRVLRTYVEPITSHALQVYQSVLATGPGCRLLDYARMGQIIAPRLGSQVVCDWDTTLQVIEGHTHRVNSVAYSPDGMRIVSTSNDHTVRVWDAWTGKQLSVLQGESREVECGAVSPDGVNIVSGSSNNAVRVWNVQTGKQVGILEGHNDGVCSVTFSPDGSHIVSGSRDKTVRVWDWPTGTLLAVLHGHEDWVRSVSFSLDGTHVVSGSDDRTVRVWELRTGKQLVALEGHSHFVSSVALSREESRIVSGSWDGTIRVWDAQTGNQLTVINGHSDSVLSVALSPDGAHIVSGSRDKTVRMWDTQTGKQLAILEGHSGAVRSVVFSPDGKDIVSGSDDLTVRVWDVRRDKQFTVPEGHNKRVRSVAFSRNGVYVVSGSDDCTVRVWDTETGRQLVVLEGHTNSVFSVSFSPKGEHLISGSADNTLRVWDVQLGKQRTVFEGHTDSVSSVAYSPDGLHVVSGSLDKTVRVWNVQTCHQLAVLEGHSGWIWSVAFSPDGAHIVSGSFDKTVRVWDMHTCKQRTVLEGHNGWVRSAVFSPDGQHIHSQDLDGTELTWNVPNAREPKYRRGLTQTPTQVLVWNEETRWISWQLSATHSVRLCWMPQGRHGESFASHNTLAVIGGREGAVTILDFSAVIAKLHSLNQTPPSHLTMYVCV